MISFGYLKLTFDISMAFIRYDCHLIICARVRFYPAFLRRCFDNTVLLKQCAYRNRGLFFGRYCDVSSYKYNTFLKSRPVWWWLHKCSPCIQRGFTHLQL